MRLLVGALTLLLAACAVRPVIYDQRNPRGLRSFVFSASVALRLVFDDRPQGIPEPLLVFIAAKLAGGLPKRRHLVAIRLGFGLGAACVFHGISRRSWLAVAQSIGSRQHPFP